MTAIFLSVLLLQSAVDYPVYSLTIQNEDVVDYPEGTVLRLTAVPAPGCIFDRWAGDILSSSNPIEIALMKDMEIVATWTHADPSMEHVAGQPYGSVTFVEVLPEVCGDGELGEDEECDDGNLVDGDECSSSCVPQ